MSINRALRTGTISQL